MMTEEIIRRIIFAIVWLVLILRFPAMLKDSRHRPLWIVLAAQASGSIVIQSSFGTWVNDMTGIHQLNNLIQALCGVLGAAMMWRFVAYLAAEETSYLRSPTRRSFRTSFALATAVIMIVTFLVTPDALRFKFPVQGIFAIYAVVSLAYLGIANCLSAWILGRHLAFVKGKILFLGLLMLTIGCALAAPFVIARLIQRFATHATPGVLQIGFLASAIGFVLVSAGASLAALEPLRQAILFYYRRLRLYSLWLLLRSATKGIVVVPLIARREDLIPKKNSWNILHLRVIETRDSIFYLYDTWASAELIQQATQYTATLRRRKHRDVITTACWLEVTRRAALADAPRLYAQLDRSVLPELCAEESTMHAEMLYLLRLYRALRLTRPVLR